MSPSTARPSFTSLAHYRDYWAWVWLNLASGRPPAPAAQAEGFRWPADAFASLRQGLPLAGTKSNGERRLRIVDELVVMAAELHATGDVRRAVRALQEGESALWPKRGVKFELIAQAELRAFGEVLTFAGVTARRHDGEATLEQLTPRQQTLYQAALTRLLDDIRAQRDASAFVLVLGPAGQVSEFPKQSWPATVRTLRARVRTGEVEAMARGDRALPDLLRIELEEPGRPGIDARGVVENGGAVSFRYFLQDPTVLEGTTADPTCGAPADGPA